MQPIWAMFAMICFVAGIILGASVAVKYYENEGCRIICIEKKIQMMEFSDDSPSAYPVWDGEEQYRKL